MTTTISGARRWFPLAILLALIFNGTAFAQTTDAGPSPADLKVMVDTLWVLMTAFLVFWMNAGFGCVESGLCRAKNTTNILAKNFVVFAFSAIAYWIVGFAIMFGDGNSFMGLAGWLVGGADNSPAIGDTYQGVYSSLNWTGVPLLAKFFFQLVFAGTAATIVSGCVAERIHYKSFMVFTLILVGLSYPITGHWIWGGGWLAAMGMRDFAGSTVVHAVGGWSGLAGILVLGPRIGKYKSDGTVQTIPGHSMALVFLGGLILWLGWFGFNPGSTMAADPGAIAHVAMTTNLACCAAIISSTLMAWILLGKPDFSMTVNGALAGLVAITAPCAYVSIMSSAIIGLIAGLIVVLAVIFFDKRKIDDPVGALSVHLVNGMWGTIAVGLFATADAPGGGADGLFNGGGIGSLTAQLVGTFAVGAFAFGVAFIAWSIIKAILGMRVDPEDEMRGLDHSEMGMEAYPVDLTAE
ncbi:MAG: ammonia permease [Acidobacteria bacterium RIFCSPLOWO2_02_FULL_59_13]|nr:MAG: ammonia permease [Acidobacteria bacterium RIFCSPLOWO2_02_FULL_59_13]